MAWEEVTSSEGEEMARGSLRKNTSEILKHGNREKEKDNVENSNQPKGNASSGS